VADPKTGNAGAIFNTPYDEYSPVFFDSSMYFTALLGENPMEEIYRADHNGSGFDFPRLDTTLPLRYLESAGVPTFYKNEESGRTEIFFAAKNQSDGKIHRDIYHSYEEDGEWSAPAAVAEINSPHYESHPAISEDGMMLVFSSDRPGGRGETDLYMSLRKTSGQWTEPLALSDSINTPNKELSPYIDSKGNLYFASKGYSDKGDYDIIYSPRSDEGQWNEAEKIPQPINSAGDDSGPAIWQSELFIASNREGGCGGYDIYRFPLCGPAYIRGTVSLPERFEEYGVVSLVDIDGGEEMEKELESPDFEIRVAPLRKYRLSYSHRCAPGRKNEHEFTIPCSDTSTVVILADFSISETEHEFSFEEYDIPFFITGYYKPNTRENLESLRLKFEYNMIGHSDSTKYIEKPGEKYDQYTSRVESAMNDALQFILAHMQYFEGECGREVKNISIGFTGYADPRALSAAARYAGEDIADEKFGVKIRRGARMDNELLSTLRAYYTARSLEHRLREYPEYEEYSDRIKWNISGKGVDPREEVGNEYKRRVHIEIGLEE
jgi:hypothetical protein